MQPISISLLATFQRSFKMVWQAAPTELRSLIILTLISGAGPAATLFLNKLIIDEAAHLLSHGLPVNPVNLLVQQPTLVWGIAGTILLNILTDSMTTISNFVFSSLRDRVCGFAQGKLLSKIANFEDIALFENPELLNLVQLTEKGVTGLKELSFIIVTTLHGIFIFIPAVLLSWSIAWWIPFVLSISVAPSVYVEMKYRQQSWQVEKTQASLNRYLNLYQRVLIGPEYAKDLRIFQVQNLLVNRWQNIFNEIFQAMQKLRLKGTLLVFIWSIISGLGVALPYIYVILGVLKKTYTLGNLALYGGLILQVHRSLFLLINNGSDFYEVLLEIRPILQVLELQPDLINQQVKSSRNNNNCGIEMQDVSFSYPGSDRQILANINLTINPNEMVAIVGENGAGKSTLTKLLCRLYDPNAGKILWQGQNLREIDIKLVRSKIAFFSQDFAHFPLTVRENVGFGDLELLNDDTAIKTALAAVGMNKTVEDFSSGLDTPLGRELEGGIELSAGQWQRIAIARTLMRLSQAELLIFDEATSSIDAKTEGEIYQMLRRIATNKMSVIISHRLALTKLADRIVVLENGRIIESGTHTELMALQGQYCLMFTRQASSY
jgi:ATP-binding cassette subfamily B protein